MLPRLIRLQYFLLLLSLPLSVPVTLGNHQINLPTEPIILTVAILLFFSIDIKELLHSKFIKHPISLISLAYLGWMFVTVPFSSDALTSAKYMLVHLSHWWVFFIGFWMFKNNYREDIHNWLSRYAIGLSLVLLFALINNFRFNFRPDASVLLAKPFFQDHALLSAVVCILVFYFLNQIYIKSRVAPSLKRPLLGPLCFSLLAVAAIYFIPSRAAWLSLLVACMVGLVCLAIKLRWSWVLVGLFAVGFAATIVVPRIFNEPIMSEARKGNTAEQFKSAFNFTTDVSNLERLNRYDCAWRMFLDRPLFGFGPGTFATAYLPFQRRERMTRISVTKTHRDDGSPHQEGRGGGAHSEYFQALSEQGFLGFLAWMALVGYVVFTGLRIFFRSKSEMINLEALMILLGLITYFVHGLFNNFLHAEELAVLFWSMLGYLVYMDSETTLE